jgi:hypothetical protein
VTGVLAGEDLAEWESAIASLVEDRGARRRIARNASEYLFGQRTVARAAGRWGEALRALLRPGAGRARG